MGQTRHIRQDWKILSSAMPGSVPEVIEILLANRDLDPRHIAGDIKDLEPHLAMRGMRRGAGLMAQHMAEGHKIVLIGDYDCDGITSTAQMALFLREAGYGNYEVVIPLREEGYGIPERAVRQNPDAKLFVAMDCGTLDRKPVELARSLGADCIVIDHHEVPEGEIAPASVLINPKHPECGSRFKEFCASGLTLLFLASLRRAIGNAFPAPALGGKYLVLAAIGTIADLVPLVSANRILAGSGLRNLNGHCFPAASQLARAAGLSGKTLTAGHVSYYIGPRINAAGRIADGRIAFDLLTSQDRENLADLALELNRLNARRQTQEEIIVKEIRERFAGGAPGARTLVMGDPGWPAGVVGIVASRVQQELHYAPVVIFSIDPADGMARGSARSVPGFDIHLALKQCADLFSKWGGHKAAAGLTMPASKIGEFAVRLEKIALGYPEEVFQPRGKVDMELPPSLLGLQLWEALRRLEPHGMGNPAPVFVLRDTPVTVKKAFGKAQNHLRLGFGNGLEGVYWRGAQRHCHLGVDRTDRLDVIFQVDWDSFHGKLMLDVKDVGNFFNGRGGKRS